MNIDYNYTNISKESLPNTQSVSSFDINTLGKVIQSYEKAVEQINTELNYYDALKITQTVSNSAEFGSKLNSLSYNNALIVNATESFTIGNDSYKRGDIVYKDNSGTVHTIASSSGAYYVPSKYIASSHRLQFTAQPSINKQKLVSISGFSPVVDTGVYKEWKTYTTGEISEEITAICDTDGSGNPIAPIVKFYRKDDDGFREVSFPTLKISYRDSSTAANKKWIISVEDFKIPSDNTYIMVVK